jgi:hypothetical protein
MGVISKSIDKLPTWVQLILAILGIIAGIYGIIHYGWTFILRALFTPDL